MKDNKKIAMVAAVNAYMQEEAKEALTRVTPTLIFSPWKAFGLQELMRKRTFIQQRARQ